MVDGWCSHNATNPTTLSKRRQLNVPREGLQSKDRKRYRQIRRSARCERRLVVCDRYNLLVAYLFRLLHGGDSSMKLGYFYLPSKDFSVRYVSLVVSGHDAMG